MIPALHETNSSLMSRSCQKIGPTRKIGFHFLLLPVEIKNDRSIFRGAPLIEEEEEKALSILTFFPSYFFRVARVIEGFDVTKLKIII